MGDLPSMRMFLEIGLLFAAIPLGNARASQAVDPAQLNGSSVDVRIHDRPRLAQLGPMKWKVIRLELASSWEFPRGSAGRSYLIRLPLTDEGAIDIATLESQPARATVRRYWPNEADMLGYLEHTPLGYAIRYEMNGGAKLDGSNEARVASDKRLFQFGADAIKVGEQIFLTEPGGSQLRFRIASLL
jgi:hypothetical protein